MALLNCDSKWIDIKPLLFCKNTDKTSQIPDVVFLGI